MYLALTIVGVTGHNRVLLKDKNIYGESKALRKIVDGLIKL